MNENKPKVEKETKEKNIKPTIKKEAKKPELKVKRRDVNEVVLPNLNLKTETVLNLFKDVNYDLNKVKYNKIKT